MLEPPKNIIITLNILDQKSDEDTFDKFTEPAKRVLISAQEEAQHFHHNYIGTEHLLLGLIREDKSVATQVLANLGVELNKVRSNAEFVIGRGDSIVPDEIDLAPRAKKVIELAYEEAQYFNHQYIGTEHLLLGLIRESTGIAAKLLRGMGVNLRRARLQTAQVLQSIKG